MMLSSDWPLTTMNQKCIASTMFPCKILICCQSQIDPHDGHLHKLSIQVDTSLLLTHISQCDHAETENYGRKY